MSAYTNKVGHPGLGIFLGILGIILAIVSLLFGFITGAVAILLGVVAVILGVGARKGVRAMAMMLLLRQRPFPSSPL